MIGDWRSVMRAGMETMEKVMADDIVERLRSPMWVHGDAPFESPQLDKEQCISDMAKAADEIERLRAKIEAISQVAGKASIDGGPTFAQIKGGYRPPDSDVLGKFEGESHGE